MKLSFRGILVCVLGTLVLVIAVLSIIMAVRKPTGTSVKSVSGLPDLEETKSLESVILGKKGTLYGISLEDYSCEEHEIEQGETFSKLMNQKYDVNIDKVNKLIELCKGKFDLRDMRAGNNYTAFFRNDTDSTDAPLSYLVYNKSRTEYITFSVGDSLYVKPTKRDIQIEERYAEGVIESSLSETIIKAGLSASLANTMADIFQYTINFHMLQKGDSFKVLYQEMFIDTVSVGVGKIFGITFNHKGKNYTAVRFKQGDDKYWNEKGENMRKSFLRSPLEFKARRTSKFGFRIHPIRHKRAMHNGVDYAAPIGTPVLAIADGVVTRRYYDSKGGGNTIWIRHSNGLESGYLHLSKFNVAQGSRVSRGQVVGRVGSTGASTGPHLDFRVKQNGKYINPENLPMIPTTPILPANKASFEKLRDEILGVMSEYEKSYNRKDA